MAGLDDLYQAIILDHSKRRVGEGALEAPDASHFERNPTCGDEVRVEITVEGDRIVKVGWEGQGCSISQASTSVVGSDVGGMTFAEAHERIEGMRTMLRSRGEVDGDEELLGDGAAFAGVAKFSMRVKCAMLPWVALEACLAQVEPPAAPANP